MFVNLEMSCKHGRGKLGKSKGHEMKAQAASSPAEKNMNFVMNVSVNGKIENGTI